MNRFYVYAHVRLDSNIIFYIGKGTSRRASSKNKRNRYWRNIVEKHGYSIVFLHKNLTEEEAFDLEIKEIELHSHLKLCNMTKGGEGLCGYSHGERARQAISKARKGNKSLLGKKRPMEVVSKVAESNRGQKRTAEAKERMRNSQLGKKLSEETKNKMSISRSGGNHHDAKLVIDLVTGIYYETTNEASKALGITHQKLGKYLRGINRNKTNMKYA